PAPLDWNNPLTSCPFSLMMELWTYVSEGPTMTTDALLLVTNQAAWDPTVSIVTVAALVHAAIKAHRLTTFRLRMTSSKRRVKPRLKGMCFGTMSVGWSLQNRNVLMQWVPFNTTATLDKSCNSD